MGHTTLTIPPGSISSLVWLCDPLLISMGQTVFHIFHYARTHSLIPQTSILSVSFQWISDYVRVQPTCVYARLVCLLHCVEIDNKSTDPDWLTHISESRPLVDLLWITCFLLSASTIVNVKCRWRNFLLMQGCRQTLKFKPIKSGHCQSWNPHFSRLPFRQPVQSMGLILHLMSTALTRLRLI